MHEHSETVDLRAPAPQLPPAANDSLPAAETLALTFSGSGREYFRIWIVNLFLTVATLGIYSAWAKVRRLQYFDRNTHLAGAAFDFCGDPKAILKGRLLALCLAVGYHYAFGFSLAVGLAVVATLLLALPFFQRGALRFRLHNTQYRGLHFDFSGSAGGAYLAYLPVMLTFLLPGALLAIDPSGKLVAPALLLYLGWPLMHGAMKRYQQSHLRFGAADSAYRVPARRFLKPYLAALGAAFGGTILVSIVAAASILAYTRQSGFQMGVGAIFGGLLAGYTLFLLAIPYLQVRIANLVWTNTSFPGVEIRCTMGAWAFIKLQTVNTVLTIASLGLYRPFAAVRVYQYRLAHLSLHSAESFERIVAGAGRRRDGAAGDGMADFLGIDISW